MVRLAKRTLATCAVMLPEEAEARPLVETKAERPEIKEAARRRLGRCERWCDFVVFCPLCWK